ncbi:MAG TPA: HAMP domain-containing sensor histidine kinase [Alphaproteobacteria bacterium]|nr:two-component sensor histidine kinase [Rhodospirillaceae bacterium]HRJ12054.1 HAMP domain-containing sensor histidine kinase [Alphaproteobacteria bacterium]
MRGIAPRFFQTTAFRLSLLYVALFGISMIAVLGSIYIATVNNMIRIADETVERELDDLLLEYKRGGTRQLQKTIESRLRGDQLGGWVYLLADSAYRPVLGNMPSWPAQATKTGRWLRFTLARRKDQYTMRALSVSLSNGQLLLVGMDIRPAEKFTDTMIKAALWGLALTLLLGIGGGYLMSRNMLRRIDVLNKGAERIMRGNLSLRMPLVGSGDEFDRLATTLNSMLNEIERLIASIRGVTTNLAHDMRSPLTRIKSRLEIALTGQGDADKLRGEISYAISESDQLLATFNALLSIAEAEGGSARANMKHVDVWEVAQDVTDLYQPIAEDRGLEMELVGGAGAVITGHRQLLLQALLNLVDNAIKYTKSGKIQIAVTRENNGVSLSVSDTGSGIPADQRAKVLEQFVRLDPARTTRGNGLGLSLVAAIARLHEAEMILNHSSLPAADTGLEVKIYFPKGTG